MRFLLSAFLASLCTQALAGQNTATTFASNNSGGVGGAVYFDLTVGTAGGVTIANLDLNLASPKGTSGTIDVFICPTTRVGNQLSPAQWTLVSSGSVTTCGQDIPASVDITPFYLPAGSHGIALITTGVRHAYTNGTGANQTAAAVNAMASTDLVLTAGEASSTAFGGSLFAPRVPNCRFWFGYGQQGPSDIVARTSIYGCGCAPECPDSLYQMFADPSTFDMSNRSLTFTPYATGYVAHSSGSSPYVPPSGSAVNLNLADDSEATVAISMAMPTPCDGPVFDLTVCSNGFVSVGPGNGAAYIPNTSQMLADPVTSWRVWHDFDPTQMNGRVLSEEIFGILYITWERVLDYGGTSSLDESTFQFQIDLFTGTVVIVFETMSPNGNAYLVGYSEGGPSADPGGEDVSSLAGAVICCKDEVQPLHLAALNRPTYSTVVRFQTSNIPAGTILLALGFGIVPFPSGLPLIPSSGCRVYHEWAHAIPNIATPPTQITTVPFLTPVPPIPPGFVFFTQSVALGVPNTPGNWLTSNGIEMRTGNL